MLKRPYRQWLAISCISVIATACGGGGGGSSGGSNANNAAPTTTPSTAPVASQTPATPTPAPTPSAGGSRSVHLTWTAPATRADGSALPASALAGYRLFYTRDGSDPSEDAVVPISGGATTSTDLSLSIVGTYTFAITAIDSSGIESALSSPVSITIN